MVEDLAVESEGLGHTFRTNSDTESILRGFVTWGTGVFARLEGMFAVAVWDRREHTLHLARDPLGIKPLFYAVDGSRMLFCSEPAALANAHSARAR